MIEYFDCFLIGLTATPSKFTFLYLDGNVVAEYTHEQSVLDGVNVNHLRSLRTRKPGDDGERHEHAILNAEHELADTRGVGNQTAFAEHACAPRLAAPDSRAGKPWVGRSVPHAIRSKPHPRLRPLPDAPELAVPESWFYRDA